MALILSEACRLDAVGAQPGLVAAERVLAGRRQVAVGAVGQRDGEGRLERALRLDLQADLGEDLEGDGGDAQVADRGTPGAARSLRPAPPVQLQPAGHRSPRAAWRLGSSLARFRTCSA